MYAKTKLPDAIGHAHEPTEPWRKALLDAAEYIRVHGWWQNNGRSRCDRSRCAGNAIFLSGPHWEEAQRRFLKHLRLKHLQDIWEWNDAPSRTAEEVISALESAARSHA